MQSGIKLISRIYLKLVLLQVAVGTLLRIVLLFNEQTSDISFTFGQWLKIFLLGAVNDWCALTIGFAVLWLFRLEHRPGQIRPAAGLHPLRHPFGRMDLRHVLQYDLRRIR